MVQSTPATVEVSLEALDSLVTEFLRLKKDGESEKSRQLRACRSIADSIRNGDVDSAMAQLEDSFPKILEDHRLGFRLHMARFVELLHQPGPARDQKLIDLARKELAPMALDAYPEAYSEFKQLLLLLVYETLPGGSSASSIFELAHSRTELAELTFQTTRQKLGLHEPSLVLILAYLLRLRQAHYMPPPVPTHSSPPAGLRRRKHGQHDAHTSRTDIQHDARTAEETQEGSKTSAESISQVADALLLPNRDTAPLPSEYGSSAVSAQEADVQALRMCLGISRRMAMDALRLADSDKDVALKDELARLHLDQDLLMELVSEYAGYRGLPEDLLGSSSADCLRGLTLGSPSLTQGRQASEGEPQTAGLAGSSAGTSGAELMDIDHEPPGSSTLLEPVKAAGRGSGSCCPESSEAATARPCKPGCEAAPPSTSSAKCQSAERGADDEIPGEEEKGAKDSGKRHDGVREAILHLGSLAREGRAEEVEKAVEELCPTLFAEYHRLHFDLLCCQYKNFAAAGDTFGALALARSRLAPLADTHKELEPTLKLAMSALISGSGSRASCWTPPELTSVASSIASVLQTRLGLGLPRLALLLGQLIGMHRHWTRSERFPDPFVATLQIGYLVGSSSSSSATMAGGAHQHSLPATYRGGAQEGPGSEVAHRHRLGPDSSDWIALADIINSVSDEEDVEPGMNVVDEEGVLRIMEILEVQRSIAISMLQRHEGDIEAAVLEHLSDLAG